LERREYYAEQQIHLGKDKALANPLGYSLHIQNSSIIAYHQPELHKTARYLPIKEVPRWVYSIVVIFYNGQHLLALDQAHKITALINIFLERFIHIKIDNSG
jgi:hypothetical protein